ncbi:MAG: hypothetical protein ACFCU7_10175, partial [Pleurocapsa sp.]
STHYCSFSRTTEKLVRFLLFNEFSNPLDNCCSSLICDQWKAEVGYFASIGFWERTERDKQYDRSMKQFNDFLLAILLSPVVTRMRHEE